MRLLLAASALALLAAPALAQSSGASAGDKAKSLDALHSEALIDAAKSEQGLKGKLLQACEERGYIVAIST